MAEEPAREKKCRHGYPESQCFTCHVAKSADITTNEHGERVFRFGRAATAEIEDGETQSET